MSKDRKSAIITADIIAAIIGIVIGIVIATVMMNINSKDCNMSLTDEKNELYGKQNEKTAVEAEKGVRADFDRGQKSVNKTETSNRNTISISSSDLMFPLFPGDYGYDINSDLNGDKVIDRYEYLCK